MSQSVKVYIVEDDKITRSQIKSYLHSVGYEIAGMSDSAEEAWEEMQNLPFDIAILDINLVGEKDGLWLAEKLNEQGNCPFLFLTSHNDKATVETAISLKPNGYLIKPFKDMDLYSAIEIGLQNYSKSKVPKSDTSDNEENIVIKDSVFIKDNHLLIKIPFEDLLTINSDGNYLELHLTNKKHLTRSKLSDFESLLPEGSFIKVHQRFVVNLSKIDSIGHGFVLIDGKEIPVSKAHKEELLNRFTTL